MDLTQEIQQARNQSHAELVAKNILDGIENLENASGDQPERRWFWELLQNAKDVARPGPGLRVRVTLDSSEGNPRLTFSHDGRPFRPRDIAFLVEQNSAKDRGGESGSSTTGRFGTGFLTTHLLSRKVQVEGVVKNGQVLKRFTLPLNREGARKEQIISGVEASFSELNRLEDEPPLDDYDPDAFSTSFTYHLDENGLKTAKKGIEDAFRDLPITLALNPAITSVEFSHEGVMYRTAGRESVGNNLAVFHIERCAKQGDRPRSERLSYLVASDERISIALPVEASDNTLALSELPDETPHLFLDFPLIGTESFPVPVVVNSSHFYPQEERNGIWLSEKDTEAASQNRQLVEKAVELYRDLLESAAEQEWQNLYVLAGIGPPGNHSWLSKKWFINNVREPLHEKALEAPIVETETGERVSLRTKSGDENAYIPSAADEELRDRIWDFAQSWLEGNLPKKSHLEEWSSRMWADCPSLNLCRLTYTVSKKETLEGVADFLDTGRDDAIQWLADYVEFLQSTNNEKYLDPFTIGNGRSAEKKKSPILPNQKGNLCLKQDLFLDDDIDDELKSIASALGIGIRSELLHPHIPLDLPEHKERTSKDVASSIRDQIENQDLSQRDEMKDASARLFSWMCRNEEQAEHLFGDLYRNRIRLRSNEELAEDHQKAQEYEQISDMLEQHGLDTDDLPDLLKSRGMSEKILTDIQEGQGQPDFEEISDQIKGENVGGPSDFQELVDEHPGHFEHIPQSSRQAFKRWLELITQRKEDVRRFLTDHPAYDCSSWHDDPRFPTVVTGVRKHIRDIYLVVRPSDQGKIVLYHDLEIDALDMPDAELWISDGGDRPQQLTIGKLLRSMGVTAGTGIRL
ncbi:MAG: ATP-binding protein [Salinibacter sp.]